MLYYTMLFISFIITWVSEINWQNRRWKQSYGYEKPRKFILKRVKCSMGIIIFILPSEFDQIRFARSIVFASAEWVLAAWDRPNPRKLNYKIFEREIARFHPENKAQDRGQRKFSLGEVPEKLWLWPKVKSQNSSGHSHCCYLLTFRRTYIRKGSCREYWKKAEKGKPPIRHS